MYSPTTRLLTILELLQSYKRMSGTEMARRLEVDGRTVRRYITMLQDMGIPIEGERGPYGTYQLMRGFKLPPLMFTDEEAVAMTLGLIVIREFQFPVNVAAVEGALAKTERVMPEKLIRQARGLQEAITFNVSAPPTLLQNDVVSVLSAAAHGGQRVRMRYQSFGGNESEREFDPYGIVFNEGYWYTAGYCHLRNDVRTFRLDRVVALYESEGTFERPADFDVLDVVMKAVNFSVTQEDVEVVLETTLERAQQIFSPIMGTLEETAEGVVFRRPASQLEWIAHILIMQDFPVRVIQPESLKAQLRAYAARALAMAGE